MHKGIEEFCLSVQNGACMPYMYVILRTTEEVQTVVEALMSGKCAKNTKIKITNDYDESESESDSNIDSEYCRNSIELLANALTFGQCPENLELTFEYPELTHNDLQPLADALESGRCPRGFSLAFIDTDLTLIMNAISKGKCPRDFSISIQTSWNARQTPLFLTSNLEALEEAIKSKQCPEGFNVNIENLSLTEDDARHISEALKSEGCPPKLTFHLNKCRLSSDSYELINQALSNGKVQKGLQLLFTDEEITEEIQRKFATTIAMGCCPEDFKIYFSKPHPNVTPDIADALKSGNALEGLDVNIKVDDEDHAEAIVNALKSEHRPARLTLKIQIGNFLVKTNKPPSLFPNEFDVGGEDNLVTSTIERLATALTSGQCSKNGLTLNLSRVLLNDRATLYLADALASGGCPNNLTLILSTCAISKVGIKYLADALASGKCPQNLTLDLSQNSIMDDGIQSLISAYKTGLFPMGLSIILFRLSKTTRDCHLPFHLHNHRGEMALSMPLPKGPAFEKMHIEAAHLNHITTPGMEEFIKVFAQEQAPVGFRLRGFKLFVENEPYQNMKALLNKTVINAIAALTLLKVASNSDALVSKLPREVIAYVIKHLMQQPEREQTAQLIENMNRMIGKINKTPLLQNLPNSENTNTQPQTASATFFQQHSTPSVSVDEGDTASLLPARFD